MTIRLHCAHCHRTLKVPEQALGKKVQCPACGSQFTGRLDAASADAPAFPNLQLAAAASEEQPIVAEAVEGEPRTGSDAQTTGILDEKRSVKNKKPRRALCGCLVAGGALLLVACGVVGVLKYPYFFGVIPDKDWKSFTSDDIVCRVDMPGDPVRTVDDSQPGIVRYRYEVLKPAANSEFLLRVYEVPKAGVSEDLLDRKMKEEIADLEKKLHTTLVEEHSSPLGQMPGREAKLRVGWGRNAVARVYLEKQGEKARVYELVAIGPGMEGDRGAGNKFFNSFSIRLFGPAPMQGGARRAPAPARGAAPKAAPDGKQPPAGKTPQAANVFPDHEWRINQPANAGCKFLMPGDPQAIQEPGDPAQHLQLDREAQGALFEVAYFDFPVGHDVAAFLRSTMDGIEKELLKATNGKVARKRDLKSVDLQGKELILTGADGELHVTRLFVSNGKKLRVYQLMVQGKKVQADKGDAMKFLDSFALVP